MYEIVLKTSVVDDVNQENSQNASLVEATLDTLLRFLNWIPLGYVFETKLINTLICKVGHNCLSPFSLSLSLSMCVCVSTVEHVDCLLNNRWCSFLICELLLEQ